MQKQLGVLKLSMISSLFIFTFSTVSSWDWNDSEGISYSYSVSYFNSLYLD